MASDIERPKRLVTLQRDGAEFVVSFYPDDTVVLADFASEGLRYASMENHQRRFECERHDARCLLRVEGRALTQRSPLVRFADSPLQAAEREPLPRWELPAHCH